MKKKRIGIIGCVAEGAALYDGQTVSTRVWLSELKKLTPHSSVFVVDTYNYTKHPIKVIVNYIKCVSNCSHVVIMLSRNGLKLFLPLLYLSQKIHNCKVYHRVIGGSIEEEIKKHKKYSKYLNSFEVNWVQSPKMVKGMKDNFHIYNAEYLENFRSVKPLSINEIVKEFDEPMPFCTFSRVSKSKGIGLAIEAISRINREKGKKKAVLHVYGPIEDDYKAEFEKLLEKHKGSVEYKGCVPSEEAIFTLTDYYMHLFPTTWSGEGFPGTIVDCFNAGLPTIASDWAYNSEIIENGSTGLIYEYKHQELLYKAIEYSLSHVDECIKMREECIKKANLYSAEHVMKKVSNKMFKRR